MAEIYIPFTYTNGSKMIGFKNKLQIGSLKPIIQATFFSSLFLD